MFLLLIANLVVIIARKPFRKRFVGFHVTHISLIAIIVSAWYNYFYSFSGLIPLKIGTASETVYFFPDSKNKYKQESIDLPFKVMLTDFETKPHESKHHIYIKKFPEDIPESIGVEEYNAFFMLLPPQFQAALAKTYTKESRSDAHPLLAFLSNASLSFLGTQMHGETHYVRDKRASAAEVEGTSRVLKMLGYKGKDVAAHPILPMKEHPLHFTDYSYAIKTYYPNYYIDHIPIPKRLEAHTFETERAKLSTLEQDILDSFYEKGTTHYTLTQDFSNDQQKTQMAHILKHMPRIWLSSHLEVKDPAVVVTVRESKFTGELSLVDRRGEESSMQNKNLFHSPEKGIKILFYWDADAQEIQKLFPKNVQEPRHTITLFQKGVQVGSFTIQKGKKYNIRGTEHIIQYTKHYKHFAYNQETHQYQEMSPERLNPALVLTLTSKKGKHPPLEFPLFSEYPNYLTQATQDAEKRTGIHFEYRYEGQTQDRILLIHGKRQEVYLSKGTQVLQRPLRYNYPYDLGGYPPVFIYINHLFPSYEQVHPILANRENIPEHILKDDFEKILSFLHVQKQEFLKSVYTKSMLEYSLNEHYYFSDSVRNTIRQSIQATPHIIEVNNPYIELELINRNTGTKTQHELSAKGHRMKTLIVGETPYTLTLESRRDALKKHWRSSILLVDKDNGSILEKESKVKVNDYLYYGGYRFYQTDAREDEPDYSGIGVTTEPGLPFIYASFIALWCGIFIMFYLKPKPKPQQE